MEDKRVRFSVVIPCYNEERLLPKTLESLRSQNTKASYEIIVVDNNCTDQSAKIAKQYNARVVTESIPGVCAARQKGTEQAKGEIIVSTDADTSFSSNWLDAIDQTFKKNKKLVALGGPCRYIDGPWWGNTYTYILFGLSFLFYQLFDRPLYLTATNIAFKKDAWEGYDINVNQGGDELGLLHQLKNKGKVGFKFRNPTYTSARRLHKGMFYSIFVSFLYYYLAGYYINTKFKKQIIGHAPAYREIKKKTNLRYRFAAITSLAVLLMGPFYLNKPVNNFVHDNASDFVGLVKRISKTLL